MDSGGNYNANIGGAGDPAKGRGSGIVGFVTSLFGRGGTPKGLEFPSGIENETFRWQDANRSVTPKVGRDGDYRG